MNRNATVGLCEKREIKENKRKERRKKKKIPSLSPFLPLTVTWTLFVVVCQPGGCVVFMQTKINHLHVVAVGVIVAAT